MIAETQVTSQAKLNDHTEQSLLLVNPPGICGLDEQQDFVCPQSKHRSFESHLKSNISCCFVVDSLEHSQRRGSSAHNAMMQTKTKLSNGRMQKNFEVTVKKL